MPKVPQLEQTVSTAAVPGVRLGGAASPESYGAGVGSVASRIGLAVYEQEAINADRTAVFEADRQAADLQTALEQKLRQTRGKNVLGVDETLRKEWDEGLNKIEGGLASGRQKNAFLRIRSQRSDQLNRLTQHHVATEFERFQDEETEAGLQSVLDRVRANPDRREIVDSERLRAESLVRAAAQRKGWTGVVTEDMLRNQEFRRPYEERGEAVPGVGDQFLSERYTERRAAVTSQLHSAVVNGFLARGDDRTARDYFLEHKQDFVAGDRQALEKTVLEGSTIGEARRTVNGWIAKGYNELAMLEEARLAGEKDPKLGNLLRDYATQHFADTALAEKRVDDRNHEAFSQYLRERIAREPGVYHDPRKEIGLDKFLSLPDATQRHLELIAREAVQPTDRPNDDALWLDFLALPPEQVAGLSRREFDTKYWSKLDNSHRSRAEAQWNAYRDAMEKGQKEKDPKITATLTFKDQVNNSWALSGLIDPAKERSKWSTDEMKMFVRFEDEAARAVQAYELTKLEGKRHATPDEVREVIKGVRDRAVNKVFTEGWFSYKERPVISLEEDEKRRVLVPVDKIPADSLADLRNYIRSKGKQITDDKLRRAYAQYVLGNRAAFEEIIAE